jgi:hypothetical protein
VKRPHSLSTKWHIAIHEAGHAVVGHLTGTAIDHVTIVRERGAAGHSSPVRTPAEITARKLWGEAVAIRRKLMWDYKGGKWDGRKWVGGKDVYVLRKGGKRLKNGSLRGTPAPELVKRMEDLRARANAIWKEVSDSETRKDRVKDLMHTLGGPVADCVFFDAPFEAPRPREGRITKAEARATGFPEGMPVGRIIGNHGAGSDFRSIRGLLRHIDDSPNWKETREHYRRKAEKLVRKHKADIERVAKALLKRKTLTGAEVAKLIKEKTSV